MGLLKVIMAMAFISENRYEEDDHQLDDSDEEEEGW